VKRSALHHWPVLLASLFTVLPSVDRTFAGDDNKSSDKVFVGYLYQRPRKINFSLYTHLCHAFLDADKTGKIQPNRGVPSRELASEAHKAGVKLLISLGGWGCDSQFAAITSNPEAEDRYIKAVMKLVDESDYDGLDLDWEYPDTKDEVAGFERLVRRLRKELDAFGRQKNRPMLLTMAVAANPGTLSWLKKDVLLETMDWLNVMTYDFAGPWTSYAGHNSPLFASSRQPEGRPISTELSMKYLLEEKGLPADRLAVGIPLYGRGFAVAEPYASTKNASRRGRLPGGNYSNIYKLQHEQGWVRRFDDETKTPWLISPDKSTVIGYDDVESVSIKTAWAAKQGFRGIFFWQIGADLLPDGSNPLQEACRKEWLKPSDAP
jgi:chitinase